MSSQSSGAAVDAARARFIAHHFTGPAQQFATAKLGMWLFLGSELLFFGALFAAYGVFRSNHPEMFAYGQYFLDWRMGGLNTVVLLTSSLAAAWSVRAAQKGQLRTLKLALLATLVLAGVFMVVKYFEYSHKLHGGVVWGTSFAPTAEYLAQLSPEVAKLAMPANMGVFFTIYFVMTGLHGVHVLVGMGLYVWLLARTGRGDFGPDYYFPVDIVALYWHLVDMIWIFLFPLFYLVG